MANTRRKEVMNYLTDRWARNPDGSKEGVFANAKIIIRIDGDITKDAEICLADELFAPNKIRMVMT